MGDMGVRSAQVNPERKPSTVTHSADRNISIESGDDSARDGSTSEHFLHDSLRPLLITMSICGFGFGSARAGSVKGVILRVYAGFWLAALILTEIRLIYMISKIEEVSLSNPIFGFGLMGVFWNGQALLFGGVLFLCEHNGKLRGIITSLEETAHPGSRLRGPKARRGAVVATILAWLLFVVANTTYWYSAYTTSMFYHVLFYPFGGFLMEVILLGGYAISIATYQVAVIYSVMVMWLLCGLFAEHNMKLEESMGPAEFTLEKLERCRQYFNTLCACVAEMDCVLAPLNGIKYTLNVAAILMLLYSAIFTSSDKLDGISATGYAVMVLIWFSVFMMTLALPAVLGSILNNKVHGSADILHKVDLLSDEGRKAMGQLSIYLNKLTTGSIGISVAHMFVLDKEAILTISGFVITYFILVVQFGMTPATPCVPLESAVCNSTVSNSTLI